MQRTGVYRARSFLLAIAIGSVGVVTPVALAQVVEYKLGGEGWVKASEPKPGSDEATVGEARRLIAQGKHSEARRILTKWLDQNEHEGSALVPEAFLLRGDARLAVGGEEDALRDYEEIVQRFPSSSFFPTALEREYEVANQYLGGLRRRTIFFGLRLESGEMLAEEILLRICERLPGSRLAERSLLRLADYYFQKRDLRLAVESYEVFLKLHPRSEHRALAMQRAVYANIARFKGPEYDASGLIDARVKIQRFANEFPAKAEQAGMSDALLARLDESAAATMLETARWYIRRGDPVSARAQIRRLIRRYPDSAATTRAIELLRQKKWNIEGEGKKPEPRDAARAATEATPPERTAGTDQAEQERAKREEETLRRLRELGPAGAGQPTPTGEPTPKEPAAKEPAPKEPGGEGKP